MNDNLPTRRSTRKPGPPGQAGQQTGQAGRAGQQTGQAGRAGQQTGRVGQLLFVAQQAAQALATERLRPLGLSPRAWGVLSTLEESGPLTQTELATTMSIDRTAMVYLLDEMEERGLAERVRNPHDRRSFLIHLTAAGQDTQRRAAAALEGAAETLLAPLDPAERQHLTGLLAKIAAHWQEVSAGQQDPATSQAGPAAGRNQTATPSPAPREDHAAAGNQASAQRRTPGRKTAPRPARDGRAGR